MSEAILSRAATHPGVVRARNEDSCVERPDLGLWAVADGAGGHGAGDVASRAIAEALEEIPPHLSASDLLVQLRQRLAEVHAGLQAVAERQGPGRMLASTVVVLAARDGHFACLWAGDSRVYLLREGVMSRITKDHSLVQDMVDAGALTEEEAEGHPQANVITRAVGGEGELVLDKVSGPIAAGDRFLLCSDGLFKTLAEAEIAALLADGTDAEAMVRTAVERGARDNVTAVALRWGE